MKTIEDTTLTFCMGQQNVVLQFSFFFDLQIYFSYYLRKSKTIKLKEKKKFNHHIQTQQRGCAQCQIPVCNFMCLIIKAHFEAVNYTYILFPNISYIQHSSLRLPEIQTNSITQLHSILLVFTIKDQLEKRSFYRREEI